MKIFLFNPVVKKTKSQSIISLLSHLDEIKCEVHLHEAAHSGYRELNILNREYLIWKSHSDILQHKPDILISVGGDGTILEAITHIRNSEIPILGINLGRLGFLSSVETKQVADCIYQLNKGMYQIESRSLLSLESHEGLFGKLPFALNDFTILKRDTSSMITIKTYLNGDFLNTYWADGIIVSTPTGSTGYSLSCGGPIVFPSADNIVITPVAPHNLNVRPVVIPDNSIITFEVHGRTNNFLCTLDSRHEFITSENRLGLKKADFKINFIKLHGSSFLKTIHNKLNWGLDKRN